MADRRSSTKAVESEPVTLQVVGGGLVVVLDDGESLVLDAREVGAVLRDAA